MSPFTLASLAAYAVILTVVFVRAGRFYAVFVGIILGLHTLASTALAPALWQLGLPARIALVWGQVTTYVYFARVYRHKSQRAYRYLVAWPASWFVAGAFLGLPWAVLELFGVRTYVLWLPFAVAAFGFVQSVWSQREVRRITLDDQFVANLQRHDVKVGKRDGDKPLRIVQITDPHLGAFMSERRLRAICERAVAEAPDLILLTGDFLTMDSHGSGPSLSRALMPLSAMPGRVFACFGNHDHEAPELIADALEQAGVELLMDRAVDLELDWGPVQIVGADHHFRGREARLKALSTEHPRKPGRLRLWLLHDPGGFRFIPEGDADLVLSGHTHGGHLGLLSLGLPHTIVSAATSMPDHGVWARGLDRLYVHRGTGHYGFPLRVGVPAEEGVLEVVLARSLST